jgi:hypothetical protein
MEFVSLWLLQMFLSKSYVLQAEMSTAADDQPLPRRGRFQKKLPRCCRAAMGWKKSYRAAPLWTSLVAGDEIMDKFSKREIMKKREETNIYKKKTLVGLHFFFFSLSFSKKLDNSQCYSSVMSVYGYFCWSLNKYRVNN